jgi:hypothetical protein
MYRSRSSLSYDILNGLQYPANVSAILAYLSYFPPPPPVLPGPPPRRSWTCSSHSDSSLSCFVSDDRNPSSLRQYISLNDYNQSRLISNTSDISINPSYSNKSSSLSNYLINLFQNQFSLIVLSIVLLILLLFIIFFLILFLYYQRYRQRQLPSNNKNKKFYYHLIPRRQKHQITINNNEHKLVCLRKDSSTANVIRIDGIPTKNNNETEEAV